MGGGISSVNANTETKSSVVKLEENGSSLVFGNSYLTREFSLLDGKLKTFNLKNYRADEKGKTLSPERSEEFIIRTMDNGHEASAKTILPTKKLENSNTWDVTSDSVADNEGQKGGNPKFLFDGKDDTYYHSKYSNATDEEHKYPHNIYIDLKETKKIGSLRYQLRLHEGQPTAGGRVKNFKIYVGNTLEEVKTSTKPVSSGTFDNQRESYANLKEIVNTRYMRIEFVDCYAPSNHSDANVATGSEINFYEDQVIYPPKNANNILSSELKVKTKSVEDIEDGKKLIFEFEPISVRGVSYKIKEVFTMKNNDSFMRKHLEIEVPEADAAKAKIDSYDLENMDFESVDTQGEIGKKTGNFWTIPNLPNNPDMANQKGAYLELGQPYYVGAMYWGSEFPQTENKIRMNNETNKYNGFIRYHYGKDLTIDTQFTNYINYNGANGKAGKLVTPYAIVGAARSTDYNVVQSDFYEYIETIATKTDFRQQFNSWYDNMKSITDSNIRSSFLEIEKGFTQYGVEPLDSYVVDDGWINYNSFWDFDRSQAKFPNELYNSTRLVNSLGSRFGLWLGPRGGYGTEGTIASWIERNNLGSRNQQSGNDINISDSRYLNKLLNDVFIDYQKKFDINYWKLDGMLLEPSVKKSEYHVTGSPFYTISETYERWTDMYEKMREQRGDKGLWINMTSYTNPSPWHTQWVNSVWMQNTGDTGFNYSWGATDQQAMLTYRDADYYDFFNDNQWQLPNKYFYNHDPVYAKTAHNVPGSKGRQISYTAQELREHLYMMGTRGTAFWEYYYSPSMFDEAKWMVNAESANWIKKNFHILQKSKMFGGNPRNGDIYGYSAWNGNEGIVSIRNPKDVEQTYKYTFDRQVGVPENLKDVYGKVIVGDIAKYQNNNAISYNNEITFTLKPKEVLIMQYGEKDTTPAKIHSILDEGNKINVQFNEAIREPQVSNFSIDGYEITGVRLKEDLRTVELTLNKEVTDLSTITVKANDITDIVGNKGNDSADYDYYKDNIINSIVNRTLDGTPIEKQKEMSYNGNGAFSIVGKITTSSKNADILQQGDNYKLSIDSEGYLTFTVNGMTVNSKHIEKQRQSDASVTEETKGMIADGKTHEFAAVREVNGIIKLYIDGEIVNSKFEKANNETAIKAAPLTFAKDLVGNTEYISLLNKAIPFDEVEQLKSSFENVALSSNNRDVKVTAIDRTANNTPVVEKSDRPFSHINDGSKAYTVNYLELNDTSDNQKHSRYVQIDLGKEYALEKLFMLRYADGRIYGPTVIALSQDENFTNPKIVFNSDKNNVHGLGNGTDAVYAETQAGKTFNLENPVNARYIRIYVNGQDATSSNPSGTSDHIVEFEAYAKKAAKSIHREETEKPVEPVNKQKLQAKVNNLEAVLDLYRDTYTEESVNNLEQKLDAAKVILTKADATQVEVDKAFKDIEDAEKALKAKPTVDKTKLKKYVDELEPSLALIKEASTEKSYKALEEKLNKAKEILAKADAKQVEVDKALADLKDAVSKLVQKPEEEPDKLNIEKEALRLVLELAKKVEKAKLVNNDKEALEKLIKEAKALLDNSKDIEKIKAKRVELSNLLSNLHFKPVEPTPSEPEYLVQYTAYASKDIDLYNRAGEKVSKLAIGEEITGVEKGKYLVFKDSENNELFAEVKDLQKYPVIASGYAKFTQNVRNAEEKIVSTLLRNEYVIGRRVGNRVYIDFNADRKVYLANLSDKMVEVSGYSKFSMWIRDEKGKKLGILPAGVFVEGNPHGAKLLVSYNGKTGYIYTANLQKEKPIAKGYAKFTQNIRDERGNIIGILKEGKFVQGVVENGRIRIAINGKTGYIYQVNTVKTRKTYAGVSKVSQYIRDDKENIVGILPKGVLVRGKVNGQRLNINYRGIQGKVWLVNID